MKQIDLAFDSVSKRYRVREEQAEVSGHPLMRRLRRLRRRYKEFWALRDVSFTVERGEVLGIIGHNGAGKSTILKLLSNITSPTAGRILINGRLAALIEVGSGFHPELTGRENIFLNGAILGMRRAEIAAKLDSIADFAGVRQFLDVPVKRFSSGMYVRLGFAIAAHLEPDILLLDEVLAVGDAAFQEKCLRRVAELRDTGTTIVFISHDLGAVERICTRVLLMDRGRIRLSGPPRTVIAEYQKQPLRSTSNVTRTVVANDSARIESLQLLDEDEQVTSTLRTGCPARLNVAFSATKSLADLVFEVVFTDPSGRLVCQWSTESSGPVIQVEPGEGMVQFHCPELGFLPGQYYGSVAIKERGAPEAIDWQYGAVSFVVRSDKVTAGEFFMPHRWTVLDPVNRS